MDIRIIKVATSNPALKLSQKESLDILCKKKTLSGRERILYTKFLSDESIGYRYFSIDNIDDLFIEEQDKLIERFEKSAPALSVSSLKRVLEESHVSKNDISCVVVSTCTGYLCPGLSSYIIEKAELPENVYAIDIAGMGCGGAMPVLQACYNYLSAHPNTYAIALSTEVSSAAIYWGSDGELILSNSIFGDGSAACLLSNHDNSRGFKIIDFASTMLANHRNALRFKTENARLRNVLKQTVPDIAAHATQNITHDIFEKHGLKQENIKFWVMHPGGRKVLDTIEQKMRLQKNALNHSRKVLYNYGNMSSPTVLYVLKEVMNDNSLNTDDKALISSFGAGFSI
jgi:predicted naringenin-chalcone synthase